MSQPDQMARLLWIDDQIRRHRFPNAQAVVETFGVSLRTAFADRDALLHRLRAPLATERERGWYYTDPTFALPFLALTASESVRLSRILLLAAEYLGEADAQPLRVMAERLQPHAPSWQSVGGATHLLPDVSASSRLLQDCETALARRQKLHLLYYSAHRDETGERTVHPYHLHNWRGEYHLIAWCERQQAVRQFCLGRVREWQRQEREDAFTMNPSFDASAYLERGLGLRHGEPLERVVVRFSPYQARWIRERQFHPSQQMEEEKDGSLTLRLEVAGLEEVTRWLLSYGAEVEAVEPAALRAQLAGEIKKLARIYANSPKTNPEKNVDAPAECSLTAQRPVILKSDSDEHQAAIHKERPA